MWPQSVNRSGLSVGAGPASSTGALEQPEPFPHRGGWIGIGLRRTPNLVPANHFHAGTDRGPFTGYRLVPKSGGYGVATYRLRGARIRGLGLSRLERRLRERLAGQAPYKGCPNPDDTRLDRGACRPTNTNREVKVAFIRKVCPIVLVRVGHVGGESE